MDAFRKAAAFDGGAIAAASGIVEQNGTARCKVFDSPLQTASALTSIDYDQIEKAAALPYRANVVVALPFKVAVHKRDIPPIANLPAEPSEPARIVFDRHNFPRTLARPDRARPGTPFENPAAGPVLQELVYPTRGGNVPPRAVQCNHPTRVMDRQ